MLVLGYRLTGEKCGSIRFEPDTGTINKEGITMSSKMTENAIEDGSSLNDHTSYVNSYNGKSSSGPSTRKTAGYDGVR